MTTAYAARSCLAVQKFLHPDTQWREHTFFLFISISTRENMSFYDTFCNSDSFYARDMVAVYQMIMGLKEGVVCFMHEKRQSMKMFRPKRRGGASYTRVSTYTIFLRKGQASSASYRAGITCAHTCPKTVFIKHLTNLCQFNKTRVHSYINFI